jgi:N-acetylmuramoyl-L-alanine amidase
MKAALTMALVISTLLLSAAVGASQDKNLLSVVKDLGAVLEWDPLRDTGVIAVGEDRIALGIGSDSALINYRLKVQIDPPVRKDGAVWLTTAAVAAISDAVQKDRLAHAGEQMRVAYILIDPGHGGIDGGGVGSYVDGKTKVTVKEKDVTLRVGQLLAEMLQAGFPDKQVLSTRSSDIQVSLEKRVDIANALLEKTSDTVLFLSIHANTTPFNKTASGYEVWCLPPEYTRTLVDEKVTGKENADIASILNSMREEEISMESNLLAREILAGLDGTVGAYSGNRGLRLMDWYVVRNARMPAVLTEVGFVSNEAEAAHLADGSYLKDVATGIYTGVKAFIAQFERNGSGSAR